MLAARSAIVAGTKRSRFFVRSLQDGSTVQMVYSSTDSWINLEYSMDETSWNQFIIGSTTITIDKGVKVYFRAGPGGNTHFARMTINALDQTVTGIASYHSFVFSGGVSTGGNILSLFYDTDDGYASGILPVIPITSEPGISAHMAGLFRDDNSSAALVDASELVLPDNDSSVACCYEMFRGCSGMLRPPRLPSMVLDRHCYAYMFYGCTGITIAPELPSATLSDYCYYAMFLNCSGISAPMRTLPATTLTPYCYTGMFSHCGGLLSAPSIAAVSLAEHCCEYMFANCTSLVSSPMLSATALAAYCYYYMFTRCTALVHPPSILPAMTLAPYCYSAMFDGCSALEEIPELPAATLVNSCYQGMFYGCAKITSAVLPATTMSSSCYNIMFRDCTSLSMIEVAFSAWSGFSRSWVTNVSASGTFKCPSALGTNSTISRGASACPAGWTVVNTD